MVCGARSRYQAFQINPRTRFESLHPVDNWLWVAQLQTGGPHRGQCAASQPPNMHKLAPVRPTGPCSLTQEPPLAARVAGVQVDAA